MGIVLFSHIAREHLLEAISISVHVFGRNSEIMNVKEVRDNSSRIVCLRPGKCSHQLSAAQAKLLPRFPGLRLKPCLRPPSATQTLSPLT